MHVPVMHVEPVSGRENARIHSPVALAPGTDVERVVGVQVLLVGKVWVEGLVAAVAHQTYVMYLPAMLIVLTVDVESLLANVTFYRRRFAHYSKINPLFDCHLSFLRKCILLGLLLDWSAGVGQANDFPLHRCGCSWLPFGPDRTVIIRDVFYDITFLVEALFALVAYIQRLLRLFKLGQLVGYWRTVFVDCHQVLFNAVSASCVEVTVRAEKVVFWGLAIYYTSTCYILFFFFPRKDNMKNNMKILYQIFILYMCYFLVLKWLFDLWKRCLNDFKI